MSEQSSGTGSEWGGFSRMGKKDGLTQPYICVLRRAGTKH